METIHPFQEWSEMLAGLAQERAESCSKDSARVEEHMKQMGWNIHQSPNGETSFPEVINSWFHEGQDYIYQSGQCRNNGTCKHYTQVNTVFDLSYLDKPV